jgi:D-serine deaminase-like pyridoxal phosphate-dependent protein
VRSGGEAGANTYGLAFYEKDFDRVVSEPTEPGRGALTDDGTEVPCFPIVKLSEEHGWVKHVEGVASPALGARLVVLPNHSCVVCNLTDTLYIQGQQPKSWKLISRGCTQ